MGEQYERLIEFIYSITIEHAEKVFADYFNVTDDLVTTKCALGLVIDLLTRAYHSIHCQMCKYLGAGLYHLRRDNDASSRTPRMNWISSASGLASTSLRRGLIMIAFLAIVLIDCPF